MKKIVTLLFAIFSGLSISNAQTQKGSDIDGEATEDYSGHSVSMPDNNTVAIGAHGNDGNGGAAGHVRIYRWNGTVWEQKGIDINGEAAGDWSGLPVSMPDSNTIGIGAYRNDGNGTDGGHVRVYRWNGSVWVQKGIDIDGEAAYDYSGHSVSMPDSNTVAIGAYRNDESGTDAGHVRIYRWNGSVWMQKGSDIDGEAANDLSGASVSMPDSNTVAIGAEGNDGNGNFSGHVRIYRWNGSVWLQKGTDINGEAADDLSGRSVSMPDSNTVAIGAELNDGNGTNSGHVRIYHWNGSVWLQKGIDIDGEADYNFCGYSNALSMPDSNTVAIGAFGNDGNGIDSGHARIYRWSGSVWLQKGSDINGEAADDHSGSPVSMPDSNTVAIGAPVNDGTGVDAGHTRVYSFDGVTNADILGNDFGIALTVYPNPTNGELSIDLGANYNDVAVIVRNTLGQEVLSKSYRRSNLLQLNIPGEAGVYFNEIRFGDKRAIVKVIKE